MKILMLTMSLGIGGAETHILELSRALSRRGHDVTVASAGGVFADALVQSGVRHVTAPLNRKNPSAIAQSRRIIADLLRDDSFDVIHAHARIPGFIAEGLARRFDVPMVTTFHYTFNPVWYLRMLTRVGERTLAVSDDLKEYLMKYYHTPAEKIDITVNGIDVDQFDTPTEETCAAVRAELSLPEGEQIVCVTRLDAAVAWHAFRLIEAMPEIVSERPRAHLTIVGGGDVLEDARRDAAEMNARLGGEYITVVGPRHDIAHILAAADVFVGVSRAAMEAMACRIPVVLTGAQGHLGIFHPALEAEAVETNFCCRTRDRADAETIARAVITLLATPEAERREMGEYNRDVIRRLYSVDRMAQDAEQMYERARAEHICRRPEVLISGYYGYGNAGDDALLSQIADGLRSRGIYRIAALSHDKTPPSRGVRGIQRFHFFAVLHALRHAKLLVSGGGSLLQDATSTKSLLYYTSVIRAAHLFGTPVMIYANGIGPLTRPANRRRAARAVSLASYISVRDSASARELIGMGIDETRIAVTADPVYAGAEQLTANRGDYIVLSLRETADGQCCTDAEDAAVRAMTEICRSHSLRAVVLPLQMEYDCTICTDAASRLADAGVEVEIASAADVRRVIMGARAVVAMRLHALIFATAAAVPSLAISYDPKIDALMADLGMSEYVLSAHHTDGDRLRDALAALLANEEAVSSSLRRTAERFSHAAQRDLDAVQKFCE